MASLPRRLPLVVMILGMVFRVTSSVSEYNCQRYNRCDACIQNPDCMWCPNPKEIADSNDVYARCQPTSIDAASFCDPGELENPQNEKSVTLDIPLTGVTEEKTSRDSDEKIIQLSPQGMKLKLRVGKTETIQVKYHQAEDYPIDLYYLMDLSNSMDNDKENLARLGTTLTDTLRNLTRKFTIGFGSFVDKVMIPYADTTPGIKVKPFAFRNNLPLSNDGELFTERVTEAEISGNIDNPEGGFDALMQAMVCKKAIGWRDQSRRIIVFSTDDKFHYAGDGRLAGIITPNDEQCHLNDGNEYDKYDIYDYPSIAQINKVAKRENINIIFAVTGFENLYKDLSSMIETSSYGLMNEDSSNVVELVVNQYNQISSKVRLVDNSTNSPVAINYFTNCLDTTEPLVNTQECSGINQGSEVTFQLEVTATDCPKNQDNVVIEVKTLQDSLLLEIELDCSCNCESTNRKENSSVCTYHGSLVCGICDCYPGYQGQKCMCSMDDASDGSSEDEKLCKAPGEDRLCSGQGSCRCGACSCRLEEITGHFCECNRLKCLSGPEEECYGHGKCDCNTCVCDPGYNGTLCKCRTDDACVRPGSIDICSGQGICSCGQCKCNDSFSGEFCEDCLACKTGKCLKFKDCVQGLFSEPPRPCNLTTTPVDSLEPYIQKGASICTFDDESDGCYFKFTYLYRNYDMEYDIHVLRTKECPDKAPVMGIVLGLVASIVAIGLISLIVWKVATTLHDRKEYAKFEKERQEGTWSNENVLYKNPTQTVQNPVFAQST